MAREQDRRVASVDAALAVLDAFEGAERLRLIDLFERTGLTRSRILRCLGTLEAAGYIVALPRALYELGPKAYRLGWSVKQPYDGLISLLRPRLENLSSSTGATSFFSVAKGDRRLVIAKAEPRAGVRYAVEEGQLRPLHVGATGRVLLAFGEDADRDRVLSNPQLDAMTPTTVTDPDALRGMISSVRETGLEISFGEATGSAFAMAAPVRTATGRLVGALSLAGPVEDFETVRAACERALREEVAFLTTRVA